MRIDVRSAFQLIKKIRPQYTDEKVFLFQTRAYERARKVIHFFYFALVYVLIQAYFFIEGLSVFEYYVPLGPLSLFGSMDIQTTSRVVFTSSVAQRAQICSCRMITTATGAGEGSKQSPLHDFCVVSTDT